MTIRSLNPATEELLETFDALSDAEVDARLERARTTFREYRTSSLAERARWMRRAAELLGEEKRAWGELMTVEMGKPIGAAISEAEKCAWVCRYYADNAERFLADEPVETDAARSFVAYQPLGPVLAIMPWNFPFWQVFRFAAPALMAGNVGLLKHASNVPRCALAIEEIFRRAGFPAGAFQTLLVESDAVGRILDDARVKAVTLTGSDRAGAAVAEQAGRAIKKTVLELGGSDAFVVMPSADLRQAVATGVRARTINNGQSCIAAKRIIVDRRIADEYLDAYVAAMDALTIGDPMDESVDVGPLATEPIRDGLHEQVRRTLDAGARAALGCAQPDGRGYYYPPSVLVDVPEGSPAYGEELFGPVAAFFRVDGAADAVRLANDHVFGLGAAAWTDEPEEQQLFIRELEAGQVFINSMVASDPRLPFGGVKRSGYGRELARFGMREFVNVKTVSIGSAVASDTE